MLMKFIGDNRINIKPLDYMIALPFVTTQMMNAYADLVYQFGMADHNEANYIATQTNTAVQMIKNGQFYDAFKVTS